MDHADWNYRPLLGWLQRRRFRMVVDLISGSRFDRLLEVAYGSGIFLPQLQLHCASLYGVDIHPLAAEVEKAAAAHGIRARLFVADAAELPFRSRFFDAAVMVSAVEFFEDAGAASRELRRVLQPGGALFVVTPGASALCDLGLRIFMGESAAKDYGDRRAHVRAVLERHFDLIEESRWPRGAWRALRLYTALKMRPKGSLS
ncbi:MAG: class I SAM-dependent methyltransferase [Planctomycetes bacterium]|nr:class I SAM-dependent methyltransferase [Planctomycetota bacterium]